MLNVVTSESVPIKIWASDLEEGALEQARNMANLPFVFKHVALMADSHEGFGMPIGGVMATEGVIVPHAVGVDIGCGVVLFDTEIPVDIVRGICEPGGTPLLKAMLREIRSVVPVGFNKHDELQGWDGFDSAPEMPIVQRNLDNAARSLGTLGGGNHFIELQEGERGNLCIMIHSGSRNLGKQICDHFDAIAQDLNNRWYSVVDSRSKLAFLPVDSQEGQDYISAMDFALMFAWQNRELMMHRVRDVVYGMTIPHVDVNEVGICGTLGCHIHHNYAALENHFGRNVWVHRKGATRSRAGEFGLIPGSQGTASYVVKGMGNPESFESCSHGAGRVMGRKQAIRTLDLDEERRKLDEMGVVHSVRSEKDLDEAPGSYKDIDIVMANQSDLVKIVERLKPVAVVKG